MKFLHDEFNFTIRLEKGENVMQTLTDFIVKNKITGGWIVGLGGLAWAELGFYDLTSQAYAWKKFDEPLELTNLTGNIAWQDNEPQLHLHATVSDASFHAYGGHLREAEVAGTVELLLHFWDDKNGFSRLNDKDTGLSLLNL